ncbi:sensory box histidine kinase/response regulator [Pedobacter sp. BAL39]|uniref:helix-turn-helix domain-containing protein n=1 Tax=Pedobacter sp. BAL39 TaxID=391596 RepID=UPI0001559B99|nr:helix-turn-helix domain-containing protein [Pedobacter sp. BAL39]EDM38350.1 sensory box histidine kinase/response regulator [Pedobacter sp. BAL39]
MSSIPESGEINLLSYWDRELLCKFANTAFFRLLNKVPEDVLGTSIKSCLGISYEQHEPYITGVLDGISQSYSSEIHLESGDRHRVEASYYPDVENGRVLGFFAHIIKLTDGASQQLHQYKRIYEIADYLKAEILSEFPSIPHLAERYFLSVSKLMRDFKRVFQTSPYLYYRQQQMEFAQRYLTETGCSKKQISLMLGFSNPANFAVCYKRYLSGLAADRVVRMVRNGVDEQHRIMVNQLPFAVAMVDLEMNYLLVSGQFYADFNFSSQALTGRSLFDFFPGTDAALEAFRAGFVEHGIAFFVRNPIFYVAVGSLELKCLFKVWSVESGKPGGLMIYGLHNFEHPR